MNADRQDGEVRFAPGLTGIEHAEREVDIFQPPARRLTIQDDPMSCATLSEFYAEWDKQQREAAGSGRIKRSGGTPAWIPPSERTTEIVSKERGERTVTVATTPEAPALDASAPGLRAELDAIETEFPGWVLHLSEQGCIWCEFVSGVTVRGATPQEARRAIAVWEHEMDVRYGAGKAAAA